MFQTFSPFFRSLAFSFFSDTCTQTHKHTDIEPVPILLIDENYFVQRVAIEYRSQPKNRAEITCKVSPVLITLTTSKVACSSGVEQVIHSFIHGTNDLKALLLQHTDVIFECKVMFEGVSLGFKVFNASY